MPALAATAALLAAAAPGAAPAEAIPFDAAPPRAQAAFRRTPWRWPTRRITYYNAARANARAVREAVATWNRSGVRLRFVAAPRSRARVVIRYRPGAGCRPGGAAGTSFDGNSGIAVRSVVLIPRPDPAQMGCSRRAITLTVAHELGHVLGLAHERRRCALMNPVLRGLAPARCTPTEPWRWRCRILEPDDVRGAVGIYGGRVRRRGPAVCDVFGPPFVPGSLTAAPDAAGGLAVTFVRPPGVRPPAYLQVRQGGFAVGYRRDTCPAGLDELEGGFTNAWTVPEGAAEPVTLAPGLPGRYCVAAWSLDGIGRLSRLPARVLVDLP
jgi:hypothetical protein